MENSDEKLIISGLLKQRGGFLGLPRNVYCELRGTNFILFKNQRKKTPLTVFKLTDATKISLNENERSPKLVLDDQVGNSLSFTGESTETLVKWLMALRSATINDTTLTMDDFHILSVIGRGFYGKVMLVQHKESNEIFAVKSIHKSRLVKSNKVHTVIRERNIIANSKYPFLVNLAYAFQTESKFYLVLEYAPGGELFKRMQEAAITFNQARLYIAEIGLALTYLHSIGVVYRDLKPENILISAEGHIKLTDFGLSKRITEDYTTTFCGTAEYIAPEVVTRDPYSYMIDWWALGVLAFELIFGFTPFASNNRSKLFHMITSQEPDYPHNADRASVDFVSQLLKKDPSKRATLKTLWNHPFWGDIKLEDVENLLVAPEFVPKVKDIKLPTNFDAEFTKEAATDSIATPLYCPSEAFQGFSYAGSHDRDGDGRRKSRSILAVEEEDRLRVQNT